MVKKAIDSRIPTLIKNGVQNKFRTFFIIVGDKGKDQVVNLHWLLSQAQVTARPSVLWCYKKELGFKAKIKKEIKRGIRELNTEDPFELFISVTNIRYTYYKETHKILGNTYGMCVLQDFEALTPNLLARTIETVEGSTIGHIPKKNIGSTSSLVSHRSIENLFDLNDPTDLQNIFLSDKAVPKELPIIDLLGDPDINTKIAIESGEIKNYETQIDILSSSNDELKIQKNNLESTLANLIIQKQEFKDLFLQTRSLYEAEFKIVKEIQIQYQLENENLERAKGELAQAERALAAIKLEKEQLKENTQKDKDEINELKKKMRLVEEETVSIKAEIEKIQKENRQQKGLLEINKKQLATVEAEREKSLETLKNFEKSSNNSPDIDNVFVSTPSTITPTPSNNNSSDIFQSIFNEPEKESADFSNEQNENIFQQPPIENGATSTVDPFNSNNFKKPTSDKSAFDSAFATLEATNKTDDDPFLTDTFNSEKFPSLEELEGLTFAFENDFKFENDFNSDKKENNLFTDPKDETVVKQTEKSNATETKPNSSDEKVASPFMNEDKVENAFKNESTDLLKELMKPSTNTKDAHSSEDLDFIFTGLTEAKVMETTPPNTTVLDAAFGGTFEEAKAENNHEFEDAFGDFLKGNEIQKTQTNLEKVIKALEDSDYDLNKAIQILSPNN
ncbi:11429_t:CDS:2 [Entrophospora sp. SA101]|nr:11429_t:CDS:2 [Entrophospora sp. SA101]